MARMGHQWTQPRSTKYRSHSPRSDFLSAKHAVRRREPTFAQLCPKIGASSEHVVPIRHTKELHQSRGILAGSPHIHAKVVLQDPVLPYMFIINWTCPTTHYFLPQIGMANMRIPPKSAELLRSPESAICVCRCMATCQNLCYKTWVGHDFRKTWCGCLVCWASHVHDPSHALSPNIYAPPKIRNHVNISDTPL